MDVDDYSTMSMADWHIRRLIDYEVFLTIRSSPEAGFYEARYRFVLDGESTLGAILMHEELVDRLERRYGPSDSNGPIWHRASIPRLEEYEMPSDPYSNDFREYLEHEYIRLRAVWTLGDTGIMLQLRKALSDGDPPVTLELVYTSLSRDPLLEGL